MIFNETLTSEIIEKPIPYGKQQIDESDIRSVIETLKSDFLTTGPKVEEFEKKIAEYVGAKYAVTASNGTAALHLACLAAGLKEEEELLTSPMTFSASANCALYCKAKPIFVDINEEGLIDEDKIEEKITEKTRIIIPIHYTGLPCNMEKIKEIAIRHNLKIIEDACHALGARYKDSKIGDCQYSEMVVFSFHPVKHISTGEGGIITTNSKEYYETLKCLRNHGIVKNKCSFLNQDEGPWFYEIQELGFNYRLTDIQCALGLSQLKRIDQLIARRRQLAKTYDQAFANNCHIKTIKEHDSTINSYHLYVILVDNKKIRLKLFNYLHQKKILSQVHYIPVYWHQYYQKLGYRRGLCPKAETFYEKIITIPLFSSMKEFEQQYVIKAIKEFFNE